METIAAGNIVAVDDMVFTTLLKVHTGAGRSKVSRYYVVHVEKERLPGRFPRIKQILGHLGLSIDHHS